MDYRIQNSSFLEHYLDHSALSDLNKDIIFQTVELYSKNDVKTRCLRILDTLKYFTIGWSYWGHSEKIIREYATVKLEEKFNFTKITKEGSKSIKQIIDKITFATMQAFFAKDNVEDLFQTVFSGYDKTETLQMIIHNVYLEMKNLKIFITLVNPFIEDSEQKFLVNEEIDNATVVHWMKCKNEIKMTYRNKENCTSENLINFLFHMQMYRAYFRDSILLVPKEKIDIVKQAFLVDSKRIEGINYNFDSESTQFYIIPGLNCNLEDDEIIRIYSHLVERN